MPKEYAEKFDNNKPCEYGNYQVATGPYMFKNNSRRQGARRRLLPRQVATLVRNPNWNASTDIRPAYLNEIQIKIGGDNNVIGRQVLEGNNIVQSEPPSQANIRLAAEKYKSQMYISPGAGSHYIGVNNQRRTVQERKPPQGAVGGDSTAPRWTRRAAARSSRT